VKPMPSDDWLTKYSGEHLFHEFRMFWWLRQNIPADRYLHDAALESFVLHLRNLIDFFYPRKSVQSSDVIATDFLDDPATWDPPASISATLNAARDRADKELSHLTAQRRDTGDPTKPWETDALFGEIKAVADKFVAKASPKKLHQHVFELLTALANLTHHYSPCIAYDSE